MPLELPSLENTVNAQAVEKALEPKDIMNLMHAFISEFFGCIDCRSVSTSLWYYRFIVTSSVRSHFLEYYDKCLFGRCKLLSFSDLQVFPVEKKNTFLSFTPFLL